MKEAMLRTRITCRRSLHTVLSDRHRRRAISISKAGSCKKRGVMIIHFPTKDFTSEAWEAIVVASCCACLNSFSVVFISWYCSPPCSASSFLSSMMTSQATIVWTSEQYSHFRLGWVNTGRRLRQKRRCHNIAHIIVHKHSTCSVQRHEQFRMQKVCRWNTRKDKFTKHRGLLVFDEIWALVRALYLPLLPSLFKILFPQIGALDSERAKKTAIDRTEVGELAQPATAFLTHVTPTDLGISWGRKARCHELVWRSLAFAWHPNNPTRPHYLLGNHYEVTTSSPTHKTWLLRLLHSNNLRSIRVWSFYVHNKHDNTSIEACR